MRVRDTLQGMDMNRRQAAAEARRSLDRALRPYGSITARRPQKGWIRAVRDALGMTAEQLGERLRVTQPTVQRMELSEAEDTIQLSTLRRAAEALGCELVYALVPRDGLQATYDRAARAVARRELGRISHSMALEDQAVDDAEADERLRRYIEDELDPREVWTPRP
jgi:predicted DNA-binding mobile mystery protein A